MDELDQPEATPAATNQQPAAAPAASGPEQFTDGSGSMNHCLRFVIRSDIDSTRLLKTLISSTKELVTNQKSSSSF